MKPALILQHVSTDGPAYLGTWLRERGIAHEVRNPEAGDAYPDTMRDFSALALLGGSMSANDALPALRQAERLILQAMAAGLPVIGHCLGGQLMARALGARVAASPAPEIGWQPVQVRNNADAHAWFGGEAEHTVMQWHYDAFELPAGATPLARSAACPHQAFAIGPHLAMQFHLEIDAHKLAVWAAEECARWRAAQQAHTSVQGGPAMRALAAQAMPAHHRLADRVYTRWLSFVS
jgi:GMP synthase (glutamine-hydrolysing)